MKMGFFQSTKSKYAEALTEGFSLLKEIREKGVQDFQDLENNKELKKRFDKFINDLDKALKALYIDKEHEFKKTIGYDEREVIRLQVLETNLISLNRDLRKYIIP